jgi:1,4-dihydroxy-2-naphthoate octaprenyltransferase
MCSTIGASPRHVNTFACIPVVARAPGGFGDATAGSATVPGVAQPTIPPAAPPAPPTGWRLWVAGARPRTLGAAIAPVVVGTAVAASEGDVVAWRAVAALVVALALQIGTNYANDHADGIRGTDANRRGPVRLTASGLATPRAVLTAALISFGVAAATGLALAIAVDLRLLVVGAVCIAAGYLYTGGPRPYGYSGLGELAVLVFFGLVATVGSAYVQTEEITWEAVVASLPTGLLACGILLANNIRDVETDRVAGKRTLAVRVGERRARLGYVGCVVGAFAAVVVLGVAHPTALLGLAAIPLAVAPCRAVLEGRDAPTLVRALVGTSRLEVVCAALLAVGLWIA